MNLIDQIEKEEMKTDAPQCRVGDTVKVHMRIVEGEKERTQIIEGVVIRIHGGGIRETLTVRKISFGIGVERIFPLHSPRVEKIEVIKQAKVRQARLYYLRDLKGKAARLKEKRPSASVAGARKKKNKKQAS